MAECVDAKLLEVLRRQARQNLLIDLVLAERGLIPFETKAPQPFSEVHGGAAHLPDGMIPLTKQRVQGRRWTAARTLVVGVPARTYPEGLKEC